MREATASDELSHLAVLLLKKEADRNFVHLTVTYGGDGTITAYRNGEPYGKSYSTGSHLYKRDDCIVSFGVRHLPANPQRLLVGRIDEASLYDFELTAEDIRLISNPDTFISQKQLYESLPSKLQRTYSKLTEKKSALKRKSDACEKTWPFPTNPNCKISLLPFST